MKIISYVILVAQSAFSVMKRNNMPTAGFNRQFVVTGSELDNWTKNISRKSCEIRFNVNILF